MPSAPRTRRTTSSNPRRPANYKRGGYAHEFTIPIEWWSTTDTIQTERMRARRRAWVRDYAKNEWRNLKKTGKAWKVERFIALIGVACPSQKNIFPARAAETIKPIIDGGSDARLWDDDDSQHRHSTVYIQLPTPAPANHYRLSVLIIPVPESMPKYQITSRLASNIDQHWRNNPNPPAWHDGYSVSFTIPDKQWITSNYTDSDLIARQNGERKSATWGRGGSFGIRERVRAQLIELALKQWKRQAYRPYGRFAIIAGIAYPYGVKTADPDNAAETVNTILHSGTRIGAWPDVNSQHCRGVAFVRLPNLMTGNHMVRLFVFPVPENFQMAQSIAESSIDAWGEHDRRMR